MPICENCENEVSDKDIIESEFFPEEVCKNCHEEAVDMKNAELDYDHQMENEYYDDLIDGVGFAHPGSNSALRAETPDNPRDQPCPTCKRPNMLTRIDVQRHYQCDRCADRAERGFDI